MNLGERIGPLMDVTRRGLERPVQKLLEKSGFVEVQEDKKTAIQARVDTLEATWALKGLDYLIKFDKTAVSTEPGLYDPRVDYLAEGVLFNHWERKPDTRLLAMLKRLKGVPGRKELLMENLNAIYGYGVSPQDAEEPRRRLSMMLDIAEGNTTKPTGTKRAVILTQTAYILGNDVEGKKETRLPKGFETFHEWVEFAILLSGGALPYMGAAVVYSELMNTGRFQDIQFVDFRNNEEIETMIASGNCDLALVAGATTYDRHVIDKLNRRLGAEGIMTVNGGVAPSIDIEPERYLANGASVFQGEFEGAAEQMLEELDRNPTPRVLVRDGNKHKQRELQQRGVPFSPLPDLPERVVLSDAYSPSRERKGYLADRLKALEMMRIFLQFGGKIHEAPPVARVHQISTSYGCPEVCSFCATEPIQGTKMRNRTIESLEQELIAADTNTIAFVDQNFHANGRDFVTDVLRLGKKLGKRFAFEGELLFFLTAPPGVSSRKSQKYFFDGTEADIEREKLLKEVVLGIEVGLEQPVKVHGTIPGGKDPSQFAEAQKRLNALGIITFGTGIIGMPEELWAPGHTTELPIVPYEKMTPTEWEEMLQIWVKWFEEDIPSPGPIPFAFSVIPGTRAYDMLQEKGMLRYNSPGEITRRKETADDITPSLDPNVIVGINSRQALEDVRRRLYNWESTKKRVNQANFSFKRKYLMYFFNLFSGVTLRDQMK